MTTTNIIEIAIDQQVKKAREELLKNIREVYNNVVSHVVYASDETDEEEENCTIYVDLQEIEAITGTRQDMITISYKLIGILRMKLIAPCQDKSGTLLTGRVKQQLKALGEEKERFIIGDKETYIKKDVAIIDFSYRSSEMKSSSQYPESDITEVTPPTITEGSI